MKRFEGKTVLITGGNSGIGLASAQAFAKEGARVVITGRDPLRLDRAKGQLGPGAIALHNNVGDASSAKALADTIAKQGIRLDAVFINAGVSKFAPIDNVDEASWDQIFNTNVKGAYFGIQSLLPLMNYGTSIVLNGSINAHIGIPNSSVYSASKAALISLAITLSGDLLSRGIRVNVVSPGPIDTPLYGRLGIPREQLPDVTAGIQSQIPLKRFGTPTELASAVVYLASSEAAFIVGTELVVDGGMSQLSLLKMMVSRKESAYSKPRNYAVCE
jgi:NAD(P)-dependent dehydrogenase (short-subunit alcohol dehydrogenase family)